jgi:hypothetical protein
MAASVDLLLHAAVLKLHWRCGIAGVADNWVSSRLVINSWIHGTNASQE